MADMTLVKQHVEGLGAVTAQAQDFLNAVNQNIFQRDQEGKVFPGVLEPDELTASWRLATSTDFSIEPCDEDDEGFHDGDDDDGLYVVSYEVGVCVKDDASGNAYLSVFVVVDHCARAANWKRVRALAKRLGWQLMVGQDGWGENELEAIRIPLEDDMDHCLVSDDVNGIIDKLYQAVMDFADEE